MSRKSHITITDVARTANVSRTLVSFVLNGRNDVAPATRARILQAIEDLGYRPNAVARNLAKMRAGAIGIVGEMEAYQDALGMQFLAAILSKTAELNQRVMLIPPDERQIQEVAQDHAVDGIIFLDQHVADPWMAYLHELDMPAVGLWENLQEGILQGALEELALHLESRGHQRVICLCGPADKLFVNMFKQTVIDILSTYGMTATTYHCPPHTEAKMAQVIARESRENRATVIVASSDQLAINALHSLHAARLHVPNDCAVTGFGDIPSAQWVQPPLTTIRVPVKTLAAGAVASVLKQEIPEEEHGLPKTPGGRLIVRRSC